jgi:hypothetical protein
MLGQKMMFGFYNAELLLIREGHSNVRFVTSEGFAAYITKYVTKNEPLSTVVTRDTTALQRHLLDTPTLNPRTSCDPDIRWQ